jgi:hypothetical protein
MRVAGAGVAAVLAIVVFMDRNDSGSELSGGDDAGLAETQFNSRYAGADLDLDEDKAPLPDATEALTSEATMPPLFGGTDQGDDSARPPELQPADGGDEGSIAGAAGGAAETLEPMTTELDTSYYSTGATDSIVQEGDGDDEAAAALTETAGDDDGVDTMTVIQIALAVVAAGALAGGFVLPLLLKRN